MRNKTTRTNKSVPKSLRPAAVAVLPKPMSRSSSLLSAKGSQHRSHNRNGKEAGGPKEIRPEQAGVRALPIRSELSGGVHFSCDAQGAKRCVRLTHVTAFCSVCGGWDRVVHLMGDKRARCVHCCP